MSTAQTTIIVLAIVGVTFFMYTQATTPDEKESDLLVKWPWNEQLAWQNEPFTTRLSNNVCNLWDEMVYSMTMFIRYLLKIISQ
jgi:ABC-type sugar transport system permease subunit